ncbi:hypothetical protein NVP2117O_48 [Vibrio phage 2.117.O._10N.261.45.E9]|nr:hypothetical protein NVP1117O_48 [Vibrio phage 1.117.O._10N.261.45.E9]AUR95449.1 hypothetical protein NVP1207B_42 [Vibrio phage 1.207.B._10N.222.51.C2]AUS02340.1 hypothetical protein NVP2117O_48 [Vibrio phage 2.117.O._10N.261.45.E9]
MRLISKKIKRMRRDNQWIRWYLKHRRDDRTRLPDLGPPPTTPAQLLLNGNFSDGTESGWDTTGVASVVRQTGDTVTGGANDNYYFMYIGTQNTTPITQTQTRPLTTNQLEIVEAGEGFIDTMMYTCGPRSLATYSTIDPCKTRLEFLDEADQVIETHETPEVSGIKATTTWYFANLRDIPIPVNTKKIRYTNIHTKKNSWAICGISGMEMRFHKGDLRSGQLIQNGELEGTDGWTNNGYWYIGTGPSEDGTPARNGDYLKASGEKPPQALLTQRLTLSAEEIREIVDNNWRIEIGHWGLSSNTGYTIWDGIHTGLVFKDSDGIETEDMGRVAHCRYEWEQQYKLFHVPEGTIEITLKITNYRHENWGVAFLDGITVNTLRLAQQ